MLGQPSFVTQPNVQEIAVGKATAPELGFRKDPRTREVWARIVELGGGLCPPSVGPHLRLAYPGQSYGEHLFVAMDPDYLPSGHRGLFQVMHDDEGRRLGGRGANMNDERSLHDTFVFVFPRKAA